MPGPILRHYRELVSAGGFAPDEAQRAAAGALDELALELSSRKAP